MARFEKGNEFWKRRKDYIPKGRSTETLYKDAPIGTIRARSDGYKIIKLGPGKKGWRFLHHENWKKEHGNYPDKTEIVTFVDRDRGNCDPQNLVKMSKRDFIRMHSVHNMPKEIKELIFIKANLTRAINEQHRKIKNDTV